MYTISLTGHAKKQLAKLPKKDKERIVGVLERIKIRPYHHTKRLVGSQFNSLRVGSYRLILDIKRRVLLVIVIDIDHRRKVYD